MCEYKAWILRKVHTTALKSKVSTKVLFERSDMRVVLKNFSTSNSFNTISLKSESIYNKDFIQAPLLTCIFHVRLFFLIKGVSSQENPHG